MACTKAGKAAPGLIRHGLPKVFATGGQRSTFKALHRKTQTEAQIQRAVIEHLRWRGAPNSFAFHPANGGWRTAVEGAILKGMGVVAGVPDVIIINSGKVFGLELKAQDGRLTDIQRETIETMRRAGAVVAVAHGIDEAIAQLKQWQLLRRDRNSARAETKTGTSATATLDTRPFALAVNHQTEEPEKCKTK